MINVLADTTYWRMNNIRDKFFEEEPAPRVKKCLGRADHLPQMVK